MTPEVLWLFFFNDTATTEIYTLSLHDALRPRGRARGGRRHALVRPLPVRGRLGSRHHRRSEEHTSELQSHVNLVCRLLLEKKNNIIFSRAALETSCRSRQIS